MFPSSLAVVLTGLLLGAIALLAVVWAWRADQFTDLRAQSLVVFDGEDFRLERPWEAAEQRAERIQAHGALLVPQPGEWGGAE